MPLRDKVKLLFADNHVRYVSQNKDHVITSEEQKSMIENCQKNGEIGKLNTYFKLYNATLFLLVEIQLQSRGLELNLSRIDFFVIASLTSLNADSCLQRLANFVSSKKNHSIDEIVSEIEKERENLPAKSSLFTPVEPDKEASKMEYFITRQPHQALQSLFVQAWFCYRELRKARYGIDYIEQKGGMSFLGDAEEPVIAAAEMLIHGNEQTRNIGDVLKIFQGYYSANLMRKDDFFVPGFRDLLTDLEKALEITDDDKNDIEKQIEALLDRF